MKYTEGASIEIKGKFICEFRNHKNDIININDLDRCFVFFINGLNIINTNLSVSINDIIDINEWLEDPVNSRGKTEKQLPKLSEAFLEHYIKNGKLTTEITKCLKELYEQGIYQGGVIDSYSKLLVSPYEIMVKSIFYLEKQKKRNANYLFRELFKNHVSDKSSVITFEANKVQNGKKGVYFFTVNDSPVYVGKSSNFQVEYNGYRSGRFINSFPNNNGTRGKINMKIADKLKNNTESQNIKWYNIPIDKSNINFIFTKLQEKGVDIKNSFKGKNPELDFFETLIMSLITTEKWNSDNGGFTSLMEFHSTK